MYRDIARIEMGYSLITENFGFITKLEHTILRWVPLIHTTEVKTTLQPYFSVEFEVVEAQLELGVAMSILLSPFFDG